MGKVAEFYREKNVLLTGATGFCGKVIVEKLLRACGDIGNIYILIREKRNESALQRSQNYINERLFEHIKQSNPDQLDKIVFINGDVAMENLNLAFQDRDELINKVHIIFHCAATVNFTSPLKDAVNINILGLKRLAELALKMENLRSFVYMSTAFSHCNQYEHEERYYCTGLDVADIIEKTEKLDANELKKLEDKLLSSTKYPNTYTLTKGLSEDVAHSYKDVLPMVVIRPCLVYCAVDPPIIGYIENINSGSTGIFAGVMTGLMRTIHCGKENRAHGTPVDYVANSSIVCAYKRAAAVSKDILFYNCTDSDENATSTFELFKVISQAAKKHVALENIAWYPNLEPTTSYFWYRIRLQLFQILPAKIFDLVQYIRGKKMFMFRLQQRIIKGLTALSFFFSADFDFPSTKLMEMFNELDDDDKKTFNFDHSTFTREDICLISCMGVRKFVFNENPDTMQEAQRKLRKLRYLDITAKILGILALASGVKTVYNFLPISQ